MKPIDILTNGRHSALIAQGKCTTCEADAKEFRGNLSRKEYGISGMCQKCQDSVFGKGG